MRPIDGEALMMHMNDIWLAATPGNNDGTMTYTKKYVRAETISEMMDVVKDAPTLGVAPVRHGRWVRETDRVNHWHCSECKYVQGITCATMRFCSWCGADMRDAENEPMFEGSSPWRLIPINGGESNAQDD